MPLTGNSKYSPLFPVYYLLAVAGAFAAVWLGFRRFYQIDEYVFVRNAWLLSIGRIPYRDFFEHHTPLFYALLAPLIGLGPKNEAALLIARAFSLLLLLAILANVWWLGRRMAGRGGAWFCVILLLLFPGWIFRAIEIRPDLLSTLLLLCATNLLIASGAGCARREFLAGVLLTGAVLCTQKAVYYTWGLVGLLLVDWLLRLCKAQSARLFASLWAFPAGLALPAVLFTLYLLGSRSLPQFWEQNVTLAMKWQSGPHSFPASKYLLPDFLRSPVWFAACAAGLIYLFAKLRAGKSLSGETRSFSPTDAWIYLAAFIPVCASILLNPIPWPYNFIPVYAVAAPLPALMLPWFSTKQDQAGHADLAAIALLALSILLYLTPFTNEFTRRNSEQHQNLRTILSLTGPTDAIFDNNGGYLFRPAAYHYWYHSAAMRRMMADEFAREMIPSILRNGAPLWVHDLRAEELPEPVRVFLETHYQRIDGPIYVYGVNFTASAADQPSSFTFQAIRKGSYFLNVDSRLAENLSVRRNGRTIVPHQPFELEQGENRFEAEVNSRAAQPIEFQILWLPQNGKTWQPRGGHSSRYYPYLF